MKHTMKQLISLRINEQSYDVEIDVQRTLLEVLRENIGLTGTKKGCGEGNCGSCTVIIDGKAINACLILAIEAQGKEIYTIPRTGNSTLCSNPLLIAVHFNADSAPQE